MVSCGSSSKSISNQIKALEIDLRYALLKTEEYGNVPYGGTKSTREKFYEWNEEVHRLQRQIFDLQKKHQSSKTDVAVANDDAPLF